MRAHHLIQKLHDTLEEEILCSDCLDQISRFVDLELDGKPAAALMPLLKQHIGQCKVCHEEYELLRHLARLERAGRLPTIDALIQQIKI